MKNRYVLRQRCQQQGIILIIALILMVVMALSAVIAVRTSGLDETVNTNTRQRVLAMRAAEAGVNYCRQQALKGASSTFKVINVTDFTNPGINWKVENNWKDANVVSSKDLGDIGNYPKKPMCLVENVSEYVNAIKPDTTRRAIAYRITVRGFSPNYAETEGLPSMGAQVLLQVMVGRVVK